MTTARPGTRARCRDCRSRQLGRRDLLRAAGTAGMLAAVAACAPAPAVPKPDNRPLALVYKGPASCSGCAEAVAALLESNPVSYRTRFIGPDQDIDISARNLAGAAIYAQPGGGTVSSAWRRMHGYADDIRTWVQGGGHYLGFCLGGYLAGITPGFGLLPGDTAEYVGSDGADVSDTGDTVIPVTWNGSRRHMYFQDGPYFKLAKGSAATVLASYHSGAPAAVVADFGQGRVGVVGPHPEADDNWYRGTGLTNPDGIRFDLGYDLIQRTVNRART